MPCRDYDENVRIVDNTRTYQKQRDKLARIACAAMTALEKYGVKLNEEAETWFAQHKIDDAREQKRLAEARKAAAEKARREREALEAAEIETLKRLQQKYGKGK